MCVRLVPLAKSVVPELLGLDAERLGAVTRSGQRLSRHPLGFDRC